MRITEAAVLCSLAACAGPTATGSEKGGPRGLRAEEHLAIADREAARADELMRWPESRGPDLSDPTGRAGIWHGTWDTVDDHRRLAETHRTAAAELQAEYDQACGDSPLAIVSVSPLERFGVGGSPIPEGSMILLSPEAGPPDKLLAAMRCHRAWMMLGRTGMDDCPLDLPGLRVSARGDANGIELSITVPDPKLVPELRRRTAHDLEAAQRKP